MSAFANLKPAGVRLQAEPRRKFLSDIVIDYGPVDVLGRLFLKADTELAMKGVELTFCSLEELKRVNLENSETWRPLMSLFDHETTPVAPENAFAMLARDAKGDVIAAQGGLLYSVTRGTLRDELESLRLLYKDPAMAWPGESARITAPKAAQMAGRLAFVGGVWYRPDWRGKGLNGPMGRINRAYAFTRWYADYAFSFMVDHLVEAQFAEKAGWPHCEWAVELTNVPVLRGRSMKLALIWTDVEEQLAHFAEYVERGSMRGPRVAMG